MVRGEPRWRLSFQVQKRTQRKFFLSKEKAEDFASDLKRGFAKVGERFAVLPEDERQGIMDAYARARDRGYTLMTACLEYEKTGARGVSGISLHDLITKHLAATELSMQAVSFYAKKRTLWAFAGAFKGRRACDVTAEDVRGYIAGQGWGAWRVRGFLIDLSALFNWADREDLLKKNPTKAIARPPLGDDPPEILTPKQARKLLRDVPDKARAPLALGLFAGLRTAEVRRLDWADIKWSQGHIEISARASKTRQRRLVPIVASLDAWLSPIVKKEGKVFHKKGWEQYKASHRWAKNALRHSWISFIKTRSIITNYERA